MSSTRSEWDVDIVDRERCCIQSLTLPSITALPPTPSSHCTYVVVLYVSVVRYASDNVLQYLVCYISYGTMARIHIIEGGGVGRRNDVEDSIMKRRVWALPEAWSWRCRRRSTKSTYSVSATLQWAIDSVTVTGTSPSILFLCSLQSPCPRLYQDQDRARILSWRTSACLGSLPSTSRNDIGAWAIGTPSRRK